MALVGWLPIIGLIIITVQNVVVGPLGIHNALMPHGLEQLANRSVKHPKSIHVPNGLFCLDNGPSQQRPALPKTAKLSVYTGPPIWLNCSSAHQNSTGQLRDQTTHSTASHVAEQGEEIKDTYGMLDLGGLWNLSEPEFNEWFTLYNGRLNATQLEAEKKGFAKWCSRAATISRRLLFIYIGIPLASIELALVFYELFCYNAIYPPRPGDKPGKSYFCRTVDDYSAFEKWWYGLWK